MLLEQPGRRELVVSPLGSARSLLAPAQNQVLHTRTPVSLRFYSG